MRTIIQVCSMELSRRPALQIRRCLSMSVRGIMTGAVFYPDVTDTAILLPFIWQIDRVTAGEHLVPLANVTVGTLHPVPLGVLRVYYVQSNRRFRDFFWG